VKTSTQPALGAIRLAWWREALERLDKSPPPAEPRLQAIAEELIARGVSGARLAEIEDGFAALLHEEPDVERVRRSGAALFQCAATLFEADDPRIGNAGGAYAVARAMRSGLLIPSGEVERLAGRRFPKRLRPLTAFARLAARDFKQAPRLEQEATPGRAAALISHRLFGTVA